jgi:outer membrane protein OmpA-like peptidoglycan-associated protein
MRRRYAVILFLFLLGVAVALGQVGLLSLPFDFVVGLKIVMPEPLRRFTAAESRRSNANPSALESNLAANTPGKETSKITGANSADLGIKLSPGVALDIARISPNGPSVFAGRAAPFAKVIVLENTTVVATTTANASGDWSLVTEHKFASTNPQINFSIGDGSEIKTSDAPAALDSISPPSRQEVPAATASPSAQLLKEFEGVVATAREEAKQRDSAANSANDGAVKGPASTTPFVEVATKTQPHAAKGLLPSEQGQDSSRSSSTTTPVPMTFVYDEATLTPEGRRATRLLLEYLILKKFGAVSLSGHADERGSPDYNMDLSRQRLDTVLRLLRDGGYQGKIDLLPKGATEPFRGVDRTRYPREELMQLDRRVELRVAK